MWDVREYSLVVPGHPTLTLRAHVGRPLLSIEFLSKELVLSRTISHLGMTFLISGYFICSFFNSNHLLCCTVFYRKNLYLAVPFHLLGMASLLSGYYFPFLIPPILYVALV